MSSINVGLVGYGFGGSVFHAPLILAEPRLHLQAVVTSRTPPAGTTAVPNVEALLSDPQIQLVVITSPSPTHFDLAKAALLAGKHVVVDKPFATTVSEADELIEIAKSHGLFLSAFQNRRWDGDYLTVKQCLSDDSLGKIYHYESHFDRFRPQIKQGWKEELVRGSGILYDLGAHLIDQTLQLFGMPTAIAADIFPQRDGCLADDYFHLVLHYGKARAILHAATMVCKQGPRFAVHGDKGSYFKYGMDVQEDALKAGQHPGELDWGIEPGVSNGELTSADGTTHPVPTVPGAYQQYYAGVAASLLDGAPVQVTAAEARDGLVIIEGALRSAAEGRLIAL